MAPILTPWTGVKFVVSTTTGVNSTLPCDPSSVVGTIRLPSQGPLGVLAGFVRLLWMMVGLSAAGGPTGVVP